MSSVIKRTFEVLPQIALAFFLFIGIYVYDDYGAAWDEFMQMIDKGELTYRFIVDGDSQAYLQNQFKYHGPAFEVVLTALQKAFGLLELREIFFFRHLATFLFFWLSGLAFYYLLKKKYSDRFVIFIGVCWYFLMPRIFADAFYNSKDIPFLSMTMICILSMVNLVEKPTWKWGVLHGMFCGFLIGIRFMGVFIPAMTLIWFFARMIYCRRFPLAKPFSGFFSVLIFSAATMFFTVVFWPVLWIDPIFHFFNGMNEISRFSYDSSVLYQGKLIKTMFLPWHYDFVWILITTPLQYILFFVAGFFYNVIDLIWLNRRKRFDTAMVSISILFYFLPLLAIIIFDSTEYDAWRHLFFLYAPFCIVTVKGLIEIKNSLIPLIKPGWINLSFIIMTAPIAYYTIALHPYQNIYFNRTIGPDASYVQFKYELDYWGTGYRKALEKLNSKATEKVVSVYLPNEPGKLNWEFLPEKVRNRIQLTSFDKAKYFITAYRWRNEDYKGIEKVDSIMVDGANISSTFKLRDEYSKYICLKAFNKKFLRTDGSKKDRIITADRDSVSPMETFLFVWTEEDKCVLFSFDEQFLSGNFGNQNEIAATGKYPLSWETFSLIQIDSLHVAFKAFNGKYISVDEKTLQLFANANEIGEKERFEMISVK